MAVHKMASTDSNRSSHLFTDQNISTNTSYEPSSLDILNTEISFAFAVIIFLLACVGLVTNTISFFVFTRASMRSSMNILLAGLAFFDFCVDVLVIPTGTLYALYLKMHYSGSEQAASVLLAQDVTGVHVTPWSYIAKTCTTWCLTFITVQRWYTLKRPFSRARMSSTSFSCRALLVIVTASILYNVPRFFESALVHVNGTSALVPLLRDDKDYMRVYGMILFLLTHFFIPFTILVAINGRMAWSIRRALRQNRLLSHSEKAAAMMAAVVCVFVVCNFVPFFAHILEAVDSDLYTGDKFVYGYALLHAGNALATLQTSTTFFIYYWCNRKFARLVGYYVSVETCCCKPEPRMASAHRSNSAKLSPNHLGAVGLQTRPVKVVRRWLRTSTPRTLLSAYTATPNMCYRRPSLTMGDDDGARDSPKCSLILLEDKPHVDY